MSDITIHPTQFLFALTHNLFLIALTYLQPSFFSSLPLWATITQANNKILFLCSDTFSYNKISAD